MPQVLVIERSTTVSLEICPFICLLSNGSIRQCLSKTYFIFLPTKISTLSLSVICEIKWSVCEKRGTHYFKVYQRCFHVYRVYRGETRLSRLFRFQNLVQITDIKMMKDREEFKWRWRWRWRRNLWWWHCSLYRGQLSTVNMFTHLYQYSMPRHKLK